jgi:putative serine protease PepD
VRIGGTGNNEAVSDESNADQGEPYAPEHDSRAGLGDGRPEDQRDALGYPTGPVQPVGPPPSWTPPSPPSTSQSSPPPPGQPPAFGGIFGAPPTRQLPAQPAHLDTARARPSAWMWPVVAVLAFVLGIGGGVAGSIIHEQTADGGSALDGSSGSGNGLSTANTRTTPPLKGGRNSVAAVAQELLPSTVQISAEYDGEAGGATGSGFVLDNEGHIITNNHVVEQAAEDDGPIEIVDQDGNRFDAEVVGRSPVYDLAVLYSEPAREMKPAALGDSLALQVGEGVVAIGSPLGLSSTVTAGIVSALQRPVTTGDSSSAASYINAVQTDAAINPGNSGGPLVNLLGQVVGVNSAIATTGGGTTGTEAGNIGVGFAIPIEQVKVTADQILRTGEARYPVIGAKVQTGQRDGSGAEIDEVIDDTPAADAGLKKGDVVIALEGLRVTDGIALIVSIRSHQPGETLEFTVLRDGDEQRFDVKLDSEVG